MERVLTDDKGVALPARAIRAGILSFLAALAFVEIGAGAVVAEAWKVTSEHGALSLSDRRELGEMLARLRVLEGLVAVGAASTMVLWAVVVANNASMVLRRAWRDLLFVVGSWVTVPFVAVVLGAARGRHQGTTLGIVLSVAQVLAIYVPFMTMAMLAGRVGASRGAFGRWYVAIAVTVLVQHLFTSDLDLAQPRLADNLGRTAALYFLNALVVGVGVLIAADATRGMQRAIAERLWQHRILHADAHQRVRAAAPVTPGA
ncbi:MAG: hypothetical protein ACKPDI_15965 [Actinomycetota bacterium]